MGKILEIIEAHLTQDDWNYTKSKDKDMIICGVNGKNATFRLYFYVNEETEYLLITTAIDTRIPEHKRILVAEYIIRANYNLNLGSFELNMETGEIQYKTSISVKNGELSVQMVEHMIDAGVFTSDQYYTGLMAIIFADKTPLDAINEIEGKKVQVSETVSKRKH